jgi:phage shock protein PspC (stress-responsive transcriptional regulator)
MKKTVDVAIGGRSFKIDEDAYHVLGNYLADFRTSLGESSSNNEVMDELEMRIADLFKEMLQGREVVDINMTNKVIAQLGMPEGSSHNNSTYNTFNGMETKTTRKFFRDKDSGKIGGVCSGLAYFLDFDVTIIRIAFLLAFFLGLSGGIIYIIMWLVSPAAVTAVEKCQLRGLTPTAENIRRFTSGR